MLFKDRCQRHVSIAADLDTWKKMEREKIFCWTHLGRVAEWTLLLLILPDCCGMETSAFGIQGLPTLPSSPAYGLNRIPAVLQLNAACQPCLPWVHQCRTAIPEFQGTLVLPKITSKNPREVAFNAFIDNDHVIQIPCASLKTKIKKKTIKNKKPYLPLVVQFNSLNWL